MSPTNYLPLSLSEDGFSSLYLDELFDLDILCTEEGIFINLPEQA
jgi:hypothetical protein